MDLRPGMGLTRMASKPRGLTPSLTFAECGSELALWGGFGCGGEFDVLDFAIAGSRC